MVGLNILEHPAISDFDVLAPRRSELDLSNFEAVTEYLDKHRPDMVIHAAGKVGGIQANIREPVRFLVENLEMGKNILLASHQTGIKQLLNLGSSCMYPRNCNEPLTENMVLKGELEPTNEGYAIAKIAIARLCDYLSYEDPTRKYNTIIPCNLFGRYDKFDPKHSHLLPSIIHKVHQAKVNKEAEVEIEIWGDGTARREFMYAGDLADAIVSAIKNFETLPSYMNIGLGRDYTINEYYEVIANVMGYQGKFTYNLTKPVGMARKLVSVDRQLAWGWQSKTSLAAGIQATYKFYLEEYLHDF